MANNTKINTRTFGTRYHIMRRASFDSPKYVHVAVNKQLIRTRTGAGVPHFKDLIRSKQSATSNLQATYHTLDSKPSYVSCSWRWDSVNGYSQKGAELMNHTIHGDISAVPCAAPIPNFAWTSTADNRARNRYLSQARNTQQSISAPIFLGELRQTYRMLKEPAEALTRTIGDYYRALRKRKRMDPINWGKAVHGLWLEYSFGWLPLMADIASAKKALEHLFEREYVRKITGSAIDQYLLSQSYANAQNPDSAAYKCSVSTSDSVREQLQVRYYGACHIQTITTAKHQLAIWGFEPNEFLPTVWELLPWSFLVDYFLSIGDMLDATGGYSADIVWTSKVIRKKSIRTRIDVPNHSAMKALVGGGYVGSSGSNGYAQYVVKTVDRQPVAKPLPVLYIKWAGPGYGQCANMSALFGQFVSNLHSQNPSRRNYRL